MPEFYAAESQRHTNYHLQVEMIARRNRIDFLQAFISITHKLLTTRLNLGIFLEDTNMKLFATMALIATLFLGGIACAQDTRGVEGAQSAAVQWLSLIDSGKYAESWDPTSVLFRASITKQNWENAVRAVRAPLGVIKSRALKSSVLTKSLPGAPDGEYVVLQFDTKFENKADAVETVTPHKESDGSWRVSGYFIK